MNYNNSINILILPGFSLKNKDWAENIKKGLESKSRVHIAYWQHWTNEKANPDWIKKEADKILSSTKQKNHIIAHSVGCIVTMKLLLKNPNLYEKIILCGIPINDFQKGDSGLFKILGDLNAKNILCIQNSADNHASFAQVEKFIHSINQQISIIPKEADDHRYPYLEEFKKFFGY